MLVHGLQCLHNLTKSTTNMKYLHQTPSVKFYPQAIDNATQIVGNKVCRLRTTDVRNVYYPDI